MTGSKGVKKLSTSSAVIKERSNPLDECRRNTDVLHMKE